MADVALGRRGSVLEVCSEVCEAGRDLHAAFLGTVHHPFIRHMEEHGKRR
jgi:hypothetical protein